MLALKNKLKKLVIDLANARCLTASKGLAYEAMMYIQPGDPNERLYRELLSGQEPSCKTGNESYGGT